LAAYQKDPDDPQWKDDPAVKDWNAWIDRYLPRADKTDFFNVYGYNSAQTLVEVFKRCGDDLTRENVMKQVTSLNDAAHAAAGYEAFDVADRSASDETNPGCRNLTANDGGCSAT
jgi:Periplasmic binding protein